jgi:hypothetical protein
MATNQEKKIPSDAVATLPSEFEELALTDAPDSDLNTRQVRVKLDFRILHRQSLHCYPQNTQRPRKQV